LILHSYLLTSSLINIRPRITNHQPLSTPSASTPSCDSIAPHPQNSRNPCVLRAARYSGRRLIVLAGVTRPDIVDRGNVVRRMNLGGKGRKDSGLGLIGSTDISSVVSGTETCQLFFTAPLWRLLAWAKFCSPQFQTHDVSRR
jgi:hypothetical protein